MASEISKTLRKTSSQNRLSSNTLSLSISNDGTIEWSVVLDAVAVSEYFGPQHSRKSKGLRMKPCG